MNYIISRICIRFPHSFFSNILYMTVEVLMCHNSKCKDSVNTYISSSERHLHLHLSTPEMDEFQHHLKMYTCLFLHF